MSEKICKKTHEEIEQEVAAFIAAGKNISEVATPDFGKPKPPAPVQILTDGTPIRTPTRKRRVPVKILLGITGPHSSRTRDTVNTLLIALELAHINMRHPMVEFTAECLGLEPHYVEHHVPLHHYYPSVKQSLGEMQKTLEHFLCMTNKNYLIEKAAKEIALNNIAFKGTLNKGHIVSNLTNEREAEWIRKNGGIVIHVRDRDTDLHTVPLLEFPTDEVIITCRAIPPDEKNLRGMIKKIFQHFQADAGTKAA